MRYEKIGFQEFKENFINHPDGFFPVYSFITEDHDGEFQKSIKLDMICEWRITDGKFKFLEVSFDTQEQYLEIKEYLKVCANLLNKAILERIDGLDEYYNQIK